MEDLVDESPKNNQLLEVSKTYTAADRSENGDKTQGIRYGMGSIHDSDAVRLTGQTVQ